MTAEAWPTEAAATAAVDAAARKAWEDLRDSFPESIRSLDFSELPPTRQLEFRNAVLPTVWAALEALPDPRHVAWAEGYAVAYAAASDDVWDGPEHENPYPSGL